MGQRIKRWGIIKTPHKSEKIKHIQSIKFIWYLSFPILISLETFLPFLSFYLLWFIAYADPSSSKKSLSLWKDKEKEFESINFPYKK